MVWIEASEELFRITSSLCHDVVGLANPGIRIASARDATTIPA